MKLEAYERLLLKWQKAINLIGESTLPEIPLRHFADSAQIAQYIPDKNAMIADLGSGAGFPGMVLAILGFSQIHLIESDIRKATFLREVSRETNTPVTVHDCRIEDCKIQRFDVVTARALAPLSDLLGHMSRMASTGIFMKGAQAEDEIAAAKKDWEFEFEIHQSISDPSGKIIKMFHVKHF